MSAVINHEAMTQCIIDDLVENYDYSDAEAGEWARIHGSGIVSAMWDSYTTYLECEADKDEN